MVLLDWGGSTVWDDEEDMCRREVCREVVVVVVVEIVVMAPENRLPRVVRKNAGERGFEVVDFVNRENDEETRDDENDDDDKNRGVASPCSIGNRMRARCNCNIIMQRQKILMRCYTSKTAFGFSTVRKSRVEARKE
mmetsp:Transcript_18407/g.51342  ORF Transcript_18407/g.51342 Transcript_18407/m.51342 type:complete len:137 (-) Transcript_18407:95-505(-)